jgi:transcriptional regulator with XRE-family HTH domain
MSAKRSFRELRAAIDADPRRRARVEEYKRGALAALALSELRETRALRQTDVAEALGVSQANVSRFEREEDVYLSTLRRYVSALGGALEVNAVFPDQTVSLQMFSSDLGGRRTPPTRGAPVKARGPKHESPSKVAKAASTPLRRGRGVTAAETTPGDAPGRRGRRKRQEPP